MTAPAESSSRSTRSSAIRSLWARFSAAGGRNAALYAVASVIAKAATLILAPLYTRRLTPSQYGDLALVQTAVALLPTIISLGLLAAVGRFFYDGASPAEGTKNAGAAARWLATLAWVSALLLQAVILLLPFPEEGSFQAFDVSCVVWGSAGTLMLGVPLVILRSSQRVVAASAIQMLDLAVTLTAAIVLVAVMGRGVSGAIEAIGISGLANLLVGTAFVVKVMPGRLEWPAMQRALRFSLPYVPHFLANQLILIADRWVLKFYGYESELGLYALASQMAAPVSLLILAWNESVSPRLGEEFRAGGLARLKVLRRATTRNFAIVAVGGSVAVLMLSPLVPWLFGPAFRGAVGLLPVLCAALSIEALYYAYSNYVFFADRSTVIPKVTFASGLTNVLLNLALVPPFGVLGALGSRLAAGAMRTLLLRRQADVALSGTASPAALAATKSAG